MKRKVTYVISLILIYNFIFPLRLSLIPGSAYIILLPVILIFILRWNRGGVSFKTSDHPIKLLALSNVTFVALFFFATFSIVLSQSNDFVVFKVLFVFLFTILISFILAYEVCLSDVKLSLEPKVIFERIAIISLIISVSVLLEVFFPIMKDIFNTVITKSSNINFDSGFRASGLASSGGAAQSFGMSLCFIIILIGLRTLNLSFRSSSFFYVSAFLTLGAVFFVGRSGFIFCLLATLIFLIEILLVSQLKVKLATLLGLLISFSATVAAIEYLDPEVLNFFTTYSLELFNNFITTGEFKSKSTSHLSSMYFLPEAHHYIFGGGFYSAPLHGYLLPDPGVMKVLLAFGIFGFLFFYLFAGYYLLSFWMVINKVTPRKSMLSAFAVFIFIVYEFKEPGLYQNYSFRLAMLLLFYLQFFLIFKSKKQCQTPKYLDDT